MSNFRASATKRVRPAIVAFPLVVLATLLTREIWVGVGADEFSLLRMAEIIRNGAWPYAEYWDVRPPLAYAFGLPSAFLEEAGTAVALLRLLVWLAHAGAAWVFFCLFERALGPVAAGVGTLALLGVANTTGLHSASLPNHFVMAMAMAAFALALLGIRGWRCAQVASALLVGALPWMMVHAAVVAASLGTLALVAGPRRLVWLLAAAVPSAVIVAVFWLFGPFDALWATVVGAPLAVFEMRAGDYGFFPTATIVDVLTRTPWVAAWLVLVALGAALLPAARRRADAGAALRWSPFLAGPLTVGFAIMAYAKPPAPPEYWVEMAPVIGLLVAVAAAKLLRLEWLRRMAGRLGVSTRLARAVCAIPLGLAVALPADPWREPPSALPKAYCQDAAMRWLRRLEPGDTVLDFTGLCGFSLLEQHVAVHPPFVFAPMWRRQFDQPWVGRALDGDGSPAAAAKRLKQALGLDGANTASVLVLADNRILHRIREEGWEHSFHQTWRMAWFRRLGGAPGGHPAKTAAVAEAETPFATLAIFVRRRWELGLAEEPAPMAAGRGADRSNVGG